MYTEIRYEIDREYAARVADAKYYIQHGHYPHWAPENRNDPDAGLKAWLTPAKFSAYRAGDLTREKAVELATARATRDAEKRRAKQMGKVQRAEAAPVLDSVSISVEWVRSRTWGHNPHATVEVWAGGYLEGRYTGSASGCGYDKRSAAIAAALNQSTAVLAMLYAAKDAALFETPDAVRDERTAGCAVYGGGNAPYIAYGAGYGVLPYFEGGVGWSAHRQVFAACGYRVSAEHETKTADFYAVEKDG